MKDARGRSISNNLNKFFPKRLDLNNNVLLVVKLPKIKNKAILYSSPLPFINSFCKIRPFIRTKPLTYPYLSALKYPHEYQNYLKYPQCVLLSMQWHL